MPRVTLIACSMGAVVDRFTSMLSLFNVIEHLAVPTVPFWIPNVSFIAIIRREEGDPEILRGDVRVVMGDEEITETDVNVDFRGAPAGQLIYTFQGVRVP